MIISSLFPGTDTEANFYQIMLSVMCFFMTFWLMMAAKVTGYFGPVTETVATVVHSCSGLPFAHPEGSVKKTGSCC